MGKPCSLDESLARFSVEINKGLAALKTGVNGDPAPALRIADIIKENGFADGARALAAGKIRALEGEIVRLPGRKAADAFRDYLFSFSSRTK